MSQRLNLLAPEVQVNPYPFFAALRRQPGLAQVEPGGFWAVSRYAEVLHVFKNPQIFSSTGNRTQAEPPGLGRKNPFIDNLVMLDPPRHTRLKALVTRAFGPPVITRLEPRVRAFVQKFIGELPMGEPVDFIQAFSLRLP